MTILDANLIDAITKSFEVYFDDNDKKIYYDAVKKLKENFLDEKYSHNLD